jgi:hypothetical protein
LHCRNQGLTQGCSGYSMINAVTHVHGQHCSCLRSISLQGAIKKGLMLKSRLLSTIMQRDHLIPEVFVEYRAVRLHENTRTAVGDQSLMELTIVALPLLKLAYAGCHQSFGGGKLVMS